MHGCRGRRWPACNCSIFSVWRDQAQAWFGHEKSPSRLPHCSIHKHFMNSFNARRRGPWPLKLWIQDGGHARFRRVGDRSYTEARWASVPSEVKERTPPLGDHGRRSPKWPDELSVQEQCSRARPHEEAVAARNCDPRGCKNWFAADRICQWLEPASEAAHRGLVGRWVHQSHMRHAATHFLRNSRASDITLS
jgi:hypothetical protein